MLDADGVSDDADGGDDEDGGGIAVFVFLPSLFRRHVSSTQNSRLPETEGERLAFQASSKLHSPLALRLRPWTLDFVGSGTLQGESTALGTETPATHSGS